jgi:hypothetical protein
MYTASVTVYSEVGNQWITQALNITPMLTHPTWNVTLVYNTAYAGQNYTAKIVSTPALIPADTDPGMCVSNMSVNTCVSRLLTRRTRSFTRQ